jgi:hypothetical protein
MSNIKALRLTTGEVVIGFHTQKWNGDHKLEDVKQCLVNVTEGRMEVNLADYVPFAKEYNFTFKRDMVMNVFEVKPQLETNYKVSTGNQRGK